MSKELSISKEKFIFKKDDTSFELLESIDENILIIRMKQSKSEITSSLTIADLYILNEFLKNRGVE